MLPLLLLVALAAPTPAERIARGEAAMASLDYDVAADELTLAASDPTATDDEKLRASLKAGIASVIVNRADMARVHFRYVLLRAPDTALGEDTPQKVSSFFALIKNEMTAERAQSKAERDAATPPTPTPTPTPAPVAAPAPAPPAPVANEGLPWAGLVAGAGAAVAAGGLAIAGVSEVTLGDAALPLADRDTWLTAGRAALVLVGLGAVVAVAGGTLALVE